MKRNMNKKIWKIYVDASVVSGVFDDHMPERVTQTGQFWQTVIDGTIRIVASDVLVDEAKSEQARDFLANLPVSQIERIESTDESNRLATEYIGAKVISENHMNDCKHIAIATIARVDAVVSWNCDDMVNPNRIPRYNEVNEKHGYARIEILTPNEFMEAHYDET